MTLDCPSDPTLAEGPESGVGVPHRTEHGVGGTPTTFRLHSQASTDATVELDGRQGVWRPETNHRTVCHQPTPSKKVENARRNFPGLSEVQLGETSPY